MRITGLYELDSETLKSIYLDALKASFRTWTDEMQKGETQRHRRQKPIWESVEYVIDLEKGRHLTIIHRKDPYCEQLNYWEFGTCVINNKPDFHAWIEVNEKEAHKIFEKYNLKIIE